MSAACPASRTRNSSVLAPLREVDALAHVLRVFDDPAVPPRGPAAWTRCATPSRSI